MKDLQKYLADIVLTIDELNTFAHHFTIQDLEVTLRRWAVERALSVVGEAAFQLWKLDKSLPITNLRQIVGMRHIIIHDYDRLDNAQLIIILQKHLPLLRQEAETLLASSS